jgi:hypothetical protein
MNDDSRPINNEAEEIYKRSLDSIKREVDELKSEKKAIVADIEKNIKSWCKKWLVLIFGSLSLLGSISIIRLYHEVEKKSEEFITKSITDKFAEPSINQTLNKTAQDKAGEIIEEKLNPEINNAKITIANDINSFNKELQQFKNIYNSKLKNLTGEVGYINSRNKLLKLGDNAIATGDANHYEELYKIYNSSTDNDIKNNAIAEIFRVKSYYASMTRIKGIDLKYTHSQTEKEFTEKEIPTEALIKGLKEEQDWKTRARTAQLLAQRKEKQVSDALLDSIKSDKNLEVRKRAMDSFQNITGFKSNDVFDHKPAQEWWQEHKVETEKKLNELQTIESVLKSASK